MKILKKNIIGFIVGAIVFGSVGITIASQILASQVSYSYEDSPSNVTNVGAAITELYGLAEECQNASSSGIKYKGSAAEAVYLDPTGNKNDCSSSNFTSDTGTTSGCMRFWVYAEDSEYKYAILDHNTTAKVSGFTNCFSKAQAQIKQDTSGWNPNLQARNISVMEIYKITESTNNQTNWQIHGASFYLNSKNGNNGEGYGWLFDRTNGCESYGCTTNDNNVIGGYWTSDAYDSSYAWYVAVNGYINSFETNSNFFGVRPVIQIAK